MTMSEELRKRLVEGARVAQAAVEACKQSPTAPTEDAVERVRAAVEDRDRQYHSPDGRTASVLVNDLRALLAEREALLGAVSWVMPLFVDDSTPPAELRKRVAFLVQDVHRIKGAPHER